MTSPKITPEKFDAVLLDLDGVITRTARVHAHAWKQMFDEYLARRSQRDRRQYQPMDIELDYTRHIDGKPRYDGVRDFLASRGLELPFGHPDDPPDRETIAGLGNRKNLLYREALDSQGVEVFPDAPRTIRRWRRLGIKTAVFSSSKNCQRVLEAARLTDLFDARVDGLTAQRENLPGKPAPDVPLHAVSLLHADPDRTALIEDAPAGIQAGKAAHFALVVGIARNDSDPQPLRDAGADLIVRSLDELAPSEPAQPTESTESPAADLPSAFTWLRDANPDPNRLLLFLDYDGTLTPIVDRPQDAIADDDMRNLLRELSRHLFLAIVSGRDRPDVENLLAVPGLIYAGSHGLDIAGPGIDDMAHPQAANALPQLDQADRSLRERLRDTPGLHFERKRFSLAVHFRLTPQPEKPAVLQTIRHAVAQLDRLALNPGKEVLEIVPNLDWHKGHAIRYLIEHAHRTGRPVYLGDDLTDENAFREIRHDGTGILVGNHGQPTAARYRLKDVQQVHQFLQQLLQRARP